MASSGLRKMLILIISNTGWCHGVGVSCNLFGPFCFCCDFWQHFSAFGRCCCLCCFVFVADVVVCYYISDRCHNHKADVIACSYYLCWQIYASLLWLMLLTLFVVLMIFGVADVVATDCKEYTMSDVIAEVADVVAIVCNSYHWQMLLPGG